MACGTKFVRQLDPPADYSSGTDKLPDNYLQDLWMYNLHRANWQSTYTERLESDMGPIKDKENA